MLLGVTSNSIVFILDCPDFSTKDDLPCELCEQLVSHLRDLLVANTTEDEFERVLQGLCKQTGQFAAECQSLVSEYYPMVYKMLVDELNSTVACAMIDICPGPTSEFEVRILFNLKLSTFLSILIII